MVFLATLTVLVGGVMEGTFALPLKRMKGWEWENSWLIYSLVGLLIIPWAYAFMKVPGLLEVYAETPARTLLLTALCGLGWGIANVLFGIAVTRVGMALSFAIVVGMSAGLGSLIPLITLTPDKVVERSGMVIIAGVALTLLGVAILGVAGKRREQKAAEPGRPTAMGVGLVLCVVAGLLAPMLNYGFAYGTTIVDRAVAHGATKADAGNAIWAITLLGGLLSNAGYCLWKLRRNRTWGRFGTAGSGMNLVRGALMGVLWTGGVLLYGHGASELGTLGAAIGWPVFQATTILASSAAGALTGEWRGAPRSFVTMTAAGLTTLVIAIVVLSVGNGM